MRLVVAFVLLCACGGPTHNQLVETPSATERRPQAEAPPASTSDKDRERSIQQFEDMEVTQRAYEEAGQPERAAPPPPAGQPAPPKKKGPAEQAELPKKKGPAEQATLPE